jgi:DNA-binding NarL/FixJ family response regulator/catechol 2,3-dioxygenase-like lactoylglutathione lyase family enzyme
LLVFQLTLNTPKAFRDRAEFSDLVKDFDQEQASALIFDLSPLTREKLRKLKQDLEKTLAELADEELRERQNNPEKIRVLIVDDIPETRENLRKLLFFESDIEVVGAATNGEEAIQMAVERQPDIVLMDFLLPGIDGIAATERILQEAPSAKVIMMSVQGEADVFRRAMMAGVKEFLIKPFSSDELVSSLRRVYQPARMSRAKHEDIRYASHLMMADSTWKKLLSATPFEFFKQQKLGHSVEIGLSVTDLSKSLCFYQQLGLEEVERGERPYPWVMLSDGLLHIGLYQDVFPSPTINYFIAESRIPVGAELLARALHLQQLGTELGKVQPLDNKFVDVRLFKGMLALGHIPENIVDSVEFKAFETLPVHLSNFRYWIRRMKTSRKLPGLAQKFGELSLKTKDVSAAVDYWEQLGFQQVARNDKPYPSAIVSDGLIRLGFHQTSKFTKPTITYFASDMPQRLERLREQGIEFISEQKDTTGQLVGAMIESPDGQPFFLFTGP